MVVILLCFCKYSKAQKLIEVSGKVMTTDSIAIEAASVIIKKSNQLLSYTYTNSLGKYNFKVSSNIGDTLILEANSLGKSKKIDSITIDESKFYDVNFLLVDTAESLNTVVLKPDEKIKISRDTISLRASAFKRGNENTVEDLLKNLPGIEVGEDGSIKALGRPIEKILIEGSDLADENYTVISKNLDVDVLSSVEIISNYQENKVLKDLIDSKNVALNLKLKNSKKSILFGSVEPGKGIENRYLLNSNIGLINPEVKGLFLSNLNNIGNRAANNFLDNDFTNNDFNNFEESYKENLEQLLSSKFPSLELPNKAYSENQSANGNLLLNKNISANATLRNSTYIYLDKIQNANANLTTYFVGNDTITFFEENQLDQQSVKTLNEIELNITPTKNLQLDFKNIISLEGENNVKPVVINNNPIIQNNLDSERTSTYSQLTATSSVFNSKAVLLTNIYSGSSFSSQRFKITPNLFLLANETRNRTDDLENEHRQKLNYAGIKSSLIYNKNIKLSLTFGADWRKEIINSEATTSNEQVNFLSNTTDFTTKSIFVNLKGEKKISTRLILNFGSKVNYVSNRLDSKEDDFVLFQPEIKISLRKTKLGSFSLDYRYQPDFSNLSNYIPYTYSQSYRSLVQGTGFIIPQENHNIRLSHSKGNIKKRVRFDTMLLYSKSLNQIGSQANLSSNRDLFERIYLDHQDLLLFKTSFTSYIDNIETSYNIGVQSQYSSQVLPLNEIIQDFENFSQRYFFTATTYLKGIYNFKLAIQYLTTKSKGTNFEARNSQIQTSASHLFKFTKSLKWTIENRLYWVENNFFEYTNSVLQYELNKYDLVLSFVVNNIFENTSYNLIYNDDYERTQSRFVATPRYFVLSCKFRF